MASAGFHTVVAVNRSITEDEASGLDGVVGTCQVRAGEVVEFELQLHY